MGRKANEKIGSSYCHGLGGNQVFAYTKRNQIMSDDNCLDAAHPRGPVNLVRCHGMGGNQEWKYDEEVFLFLYHFRNMIKFITNVVFLFGRNAQ